MMDGLKRIPCTLMHPGLFPAFPHNPPRIRVTVEIGSGKLSFVSSSGGQDRTLASEPIGNIGNVTIRQLSENAQGLEILKKGLLRAAVVGAAGLIFLLCRSYSLGFGLLIGLALAGASDALSFLLNGGLAIKDDVVRFCFVPLEHGIVPLLSGVKG